MASRNIITKFLDTASRISLGVALVLIWGWMYIRVDNLFPVNTALWQSRLLTYLIFTSIVFSLDAIASRKTEQSLFKAGFLKEFWKFGIFAGISFAVLFAFKFTFQNQALPQIWLSLSAIGLGVILLHAFMVSTIEELVFRGWLVNNLKAQGIRTNIVWFLQALIFALFHFIIGSEITTILIYLPLGYLFMFIKERYSPLTNMANAGVHFGWNLFILGFLS